MGFESNKSSIINHKRLYLYLQFFFLNYYYYYYYPRSPSLKRQPVLVWWGWTSDIYVYIPSFYFDIIHFSLHFFYMLSTFFLYIFHFPRDIIQFSQHFFFGFSTFHCQILFAFYCIHFSLFRSHFIYENTNHENIFMDQVFFFFLLFMSYLLKY